VTFTLLSLLTL